MLSSIQITNFRGFENLELKDLGRINLIVGRNNTGKTSLLEAISFVCDPKQAGSLPALFRPQWTRQNDARDARFYRWLLRNGVEDSVIRINAQTDEGMLRVAAGKALAGRTKPPDHGLDSPYHLSSQGSVNGSFDYSFQHTQRLVRICNISVLHRDSTKLVKDFAEAVRSVSGEQQLETLLRNVDQRIRSVRLDYDRNDSPQIVIDIGLGERIPIQQAGQGIYRLIAVYSEMLGQKPDICFIDEIENGLHHTILPQVWKGIAEAASRLNIQVFATTHSNECFVAAHEAFAHREPYDLRVIQLYNVDNRIEGRTLGREHIEAAIDGEIDLR
ncbi:MAG: AAA family ATPase [Opitutaceae bacterium]|jgi:predicted ATP-dependent endonuclease of OLD family|nr:AAA family ATPase [Opitutaceae bacterium]